MFQAGETLSLSDASLFHTVGLRSDGTVVTTGDNYYGQCEVSTWRNIVAIAACDEATYGLCADGTMVSTKMKLNLQMVPLKDRFVSGFRAFFRLIDDGQVKCIDYPYKVYAEKWRNIVAIDAGITYTVGLRSDGTVIAIYNRNGQCDVGFWENITAICTNNEELFGLCRNGTVVAIDSGWDTSSMRNVTGIACGPGVLLGLHADDTLTAIGYKGKTAEFFGELQTWRGIVAAAAGWGFIIGLHADGTVIAAGNDSEGALNVLSWRQIISVRCGLQSKYRQAAVPPHSL